MATDAPEKHNADITPDIPGLRSAEQEGGFYNPDNKDDRPAGDATDPRGDKLQSQENAGGGFYNPKDKSSKGSLTSKLAKNKKSIVFGFLGLSGLTGILGLLFGLSSLNLPNFMANVEKRAFLRYQVDMDGRSSKWISAYMTLRMGEIEDFDDPDGNIHERKNIYFQSRVDNNNPLKDWYKTLRSSKFEKDLFEKHGIKFTSVAYKENGAYRFRTGVISVNDKPVKFELTAAERKTVLRDVPDVNGLNGRLQAFFDLDTSKGENGLMKDKEARSALRTALKETYPHWWQAYKRRYLRLDMMNRLGIRKWKLFETTRNNVRESYMEGRNKIVGKVVASISPGDSSQHFLNCLFALTECDAPKDPAKHAAAGEEFFEKAAEEGVKEGLEYVTEHELSDSEDPEKKTKVDPSDAVSGVENAEKEATSTTKTPGKDLPKSSALIIRKSLVSLIKTTNALSLVDLLAKFHNTLNSGKLSAIVTASRAATAMGIYSTFKIADDQIKTGDMNSQEADAFMSQYGNLSNGEAWTTVMRSSSGRVSAASSSSDYTKAKDKAEYCSDEHQEEILKPENKTASDKEFAYLCDNDIIGTKTNAKRFENAWNKGPGMILDPFIKTYDATHIGTVIEAFNKVVGTVLNPVISKTLEGLHIDDDVSSVFAYIGQKALAFGGGATTTDFYTPSGKMGNQAFQGGAALAETGSRMSGAAKTNEKTARQSATRVIAYQQKDFENSSTFERYLATSNPDSFISKQIPVASSIRYSSTATTLTRFFGSITSLPSKIIDTPVHAADLDGYAVARLADIETYDFPDECINSDPLTMTPQSSTNADDLGYVSASELSWDVMSSKSEWYKLLYEKVDDEEKVQQVWNCALLDNAIRGSVGAPYGYKGKDYFESSGSSSSANNPQTSSGNPSLQANKDKFTDILNLPDGYVGPPSIAYYNQCSDSRWASKEYGAAGRTICTSGCGPTSLAMIISTIGGKIINPYDMGLKTKPFYVNGAGTSMGGAITTVKDLGLQYSRVQPSGNAIKDILAKGGFIVMNAAASSPFTDGGHFIVIRAVSEDGSKFYVADPSNGNLNNSSRNTTAYNVSDIKGWLGPEGLYGVYR